MSAWISLTKKELRLGLPMFLVPIISFIVIAAIAFYFGSRNGYPWESVLGLSAFANGLLIFYLVYYLLFSLQVEKKRLHLWLHHPMPGASLLLAKVTAAVVSMAATAIVTGGTLFLSYSMSHEAQQHFQVTGFTELILFAGTHLVLVALSLAVFFLFYSMIFLVFIGRVGTFLSFLATFFIFIVTTSLYNWFSESALYEKLTSWGAIERNMLEGISFMIDATSAEIISDTHTVTLYAGVYLFETVLAILLFLAASWLLDKKVEV